MACGIEKQCRRTRINFAVERGIPSNSPIQSRTSHLQEICQRTRLKAAGRNRGPTPAIRDNGGFLVACSVLKVLSKKSWSSSHGNLNTGPTNPQSQQQTHGHGGPHVGECASSVTSPSTLTSFNDRWATRAAQCRNTSCTSWN